MSIDRSKYKATLINNLEKVSNTNVDKSRPNYLKIEPGFNKFRIFPVHPESRGKSFAEKIETYFLDVEQDEYLNDEKTGKRIIKRKRVFNATVHSDTLTKDPVEEYKKFAEKIIIENSLNEEEKIKKLENLLKYPNGLNSQRTCYVYASKIEDGKMGDVGLLELKASMMYRINELSAMENSENNPIGLDPFTDPDSGLPVLITYNKGNKDPKKIYSLDILKEFDKSSKMLKEYPISEDKLKDFSEKKDLYSMFRGVYKRRDFEFAINGLENYDKKYNLGVFQYDEFLDILDEISNNLPEEEVKDKLSDSQLDEMIDKQLPLKTGKISNSNNKKTSLEDESEKGDLPWEDKFDKMDRKSLKDFIMENEIPLIVTSKTSDEEIKNGLREWEKSEEEKIESGLSEDSLNTPEKTSSPSLDIQDKLAALREKMKK